MIKKIIQQNLKYTTQEDLKIFSEIINYILENISKHKDLTGKSFWEIIKKITQDIKNLFNCVVKFRKFKKFKDEPEKCKDSLPVIEKTKEVNEKCKDEIIKLNDIKKKKIDNKVEIDEYQNNKEKAKIIKVINGPDYKNCDEITLNEDKIRHKYIKYFGSNKYCDEKIIQIKFLNCIDNKSKEKCENLIKEINNKCKKIQEKYELKNKCEVGRKLINGPNKNCDDRITSSEISNLKTKIIDLKEGVIDKVEDLKCSDKNQNPNKITSSDEKCKDKVISIEKLKLENDCNENIEHIKNGPDQKCVDKIIPKDEIETLNQEETKNTLNKTKINKKMKNEKCNKKDSREKNTRTNENCKEIVYSSDIPSQDCKKVEKKEIANSPDQECEDRLITTDASEIEKKKNIHLKTLKSNEIKCNKELKKERKNNTDEDCQDIVSSQQIPIDCKDKEEFERIQLKDKQCLDKV